MMNYKNIMLAVDLGKDTENLLKKAHQQAVLNQATLTLIHVDPDFSAFYPLDEEKDVIYAKDALHYESVLKMKALIDELNIKVDAHILASGALEDEILKQVDHCGIDLLMLGHHQSGFLRQIFLAPSEPLIRKMPCDVILIKL